MPELTLQQKLEKRKLHPVNRAFFGFLANVVVKGALVKKYNVHFSYKDDVSAYRGQSYVVVSNHASRMDYVFTAPAFLPDSFNFVVGWNEFFRSHLAFILRAAQVIPKKNFVSQPYSIRQIGLSACALNSFARSTRRPVSKTLITAKATSISRKNMRECWQILASCRIRECTFLSWRTRQ